MALVKESCEHLHIGILRSHDKSMCVNVCADKYKHVQLVNTEKILNEALPYWTDVKPSPR